MKPENYIATGILELYVAGVLPEEEMREVSFIVSQDPILQSEVQSIENALIMYAQIQVSLPEKDYLLEIIDNLDREIKTPIEKPTHQQIQEKKKKVIEHYPKEPQHVNIRVSESRSNNGFTWAWAAILLVFLVASIGANIYLYSHWKEASQVADNFETEKQQAAGDYAQLKSQLTEIQTELDIFKDPNTRTIQLKGPQDHPTMLSTVIYNKQSQKVFLKIQNLPAPPPDKQYQLWAMNENNEPVDVGMVPKDAKPGSIIDMKNMHSAQSFAVTLENSGGSDKPTMSQMYMSGTI